MSSNDLLQIMKLNECFDNFRLVNGTQKTTKNKKKNKDRLNTKAQHVRTFKQTCSSDLTRQIKISLVLANKVVSVVSLRGCRRK